MYAISPLAASQTPRWLGLTLSCLLLAVAQSSLAGSRYAEQNLAKQLSKSIKIGQKHWLDTDEHPFLAIYTEAQTPKSRGAVILLHGLGAHPDWPQMISPLRTRLPESGWNTLSIHLGQLGHLGSARDYEHLYRDSGKRIKAAIEFLEQKGIYNIVLIGHSLGGSMALYHLGGEKTASNKDIIAFVGIAMYDPDGISKTFSGSAAIPKLSIPILDVYGSLDTVEVQSAAKKRRIAGRRIAKRLLFQVQISGADHFFSGLEDTLLKRIRAWINKQAPSMEIEREN